MALFEQTGKLCPKILIAGTDSGYSHGTCQVLDSKDIRYVRAQNGDAALKAINAAPGAFAIILSDQDLPDMDGISLLTRIKAQQPDILRFLVLDTLNCDLLKSAVNDASVHQCVAAPFAPQDLAEKIRLGLARFEQDFERRRAFNLARKQNGKLYELNCELIETVKSEEKKLDELEKQVRALRNRLGEKTLKRPLPTDKLAVLIQKNIAGIEKDLANSEDQLFEQTIGTLYADFINFARDNSIEISTPHDLIYETGEQSR